MFAKKSFGIPSWLKSRSGIVLLAFLAIAAFYLITEHTAHVLGFLPFAILLVCPLLHLFMHGGHGGHGGQDDAPDKQSAGANRSVGSTGHQH